MAAFQASRFAPERRAPAEGIRCVRRVSSLLARAGRGLAGQTAGASGPGCHGRELRAGRLRAPSARWGTGPGPPRQRHLCGFWAQPAGALPSAAWGTVTLSVRPRGARAQGRCHPAQRAGLPPAVAPPVPRLCAPSPAPGQGGGQQPGRLSGCSFSPEAPALVSFRSRPFLKSSSRLRKSNLGITRSQMGHIRVAAWHAADGSDTQK